MPQARVIMLQGTASNVGKSVLCTALCRIFRQDGFRVAPFKAQNMSNNSCVTPCGGEIGRAQGVQAEAAGVSPTVHMNPILIKPKQDSFSQIILRGNPMGDMSVNQYYSVLPELEAAVRESLASLMADFDLVVMEGAGSPAEINLREKDIVNMKTAEMADAPVILVGDIDRGGVFASLIGTEELLEPWERQRVKGYIINKFRGDRFLLTSGLDFLEQRTGKKVFGVIPYLDLTGIDQEDAVVLEERSGGARELSREDSIDIAVIVLPRISNFNDFDPLQSAPGVNLRFVRPGDPLGEPDVILIPGTKNTLADLKYLRDSGYAEGIIRHARMGKWVAGICGGFQILGQEIRDHQGVESSPGTVKGLGLLDVITVFRQEKVTNLIQGTIVARNGFWAVLEGCPISGYEIHMGVTYPVKEDRPLLCIQRKGCSQKVPEGAVSENGRVFGTYLHGLFENQRFVEEWINRIRSEKGFPPVHLPGHILGDRDAVFDRLAEEVRRNLEMEAIYSLLDM